MYDKVVILLALHYCDFDAGTASQLPNCWDDSDPTMLAVVITVVRVYIK
jgi:hypothetical protein